MITNFSHINRKTVVQKHKFTFLFKKLDQRIHIHILSRTSIKKLIFSKLLYDSFFQRGFRITVSSII